MGLTLGVGPFLGFLFVPFLGHASDRLSDSAPLGKRKPFILALCSLLFLSLIAIPHCGHSVRSRLSIEDEEKAAAVAGVAAPSPPRLVVASGPHHFLPLPQRGRFRLLQSSLPQSVRGVVK